MCALLYMHTHIFSMQNYYFFLTYTSAWVFFVVLVEISPIKKAVRRLGGYNTRELEN